MPFSARIATTPGPRALLLDILRLDPNNAEAKQNLHVLRQRPAAGTA
jgi:hypothetical protein